jgi:hypothetical protein
MPIQQDRPSITTTLEERYASQEVGGAYDAKSIQTAQGSRMPIVSSDGTGPAITETQWTNPNFLVKEAMQQTEFKDALDGQTSKQLSSMLQGFSNKKYKP